MNKAIFIDRDGVINKLPPKYPNDGIGDIQNYITKWEDFEFLDGVFDAFLLMENTDYIPIVVSNQGGAIGRGLVENQKIIEIFYLMGQALSKRYCKPFGWYFCNHLHTDRCCCCKPKPGMLYQAAIEHDICLEDSWVIGDSRSDIDAADNANVPNCIKIGLELDNGIMLEQNYLYHGNEGTNRIAPVKPSLLEAVQYIMAAEDD